jgi:hypothetical protein
MNVLLIFSFWFTVGAYVVHVVDESLLGSSFVEKIRLAWGDRTLMERFLAFMVGGSLLRILTRTGEQHPHLDGLLLYHPLPTSWGNHCATNFMGRSVHWIACRHVSVFLYFAYERGAGHDRSDYANLCDGCSLTLP